MKRPMLLLLALAILAIAPAALAGKPQPPPQPPADPAIVFRDIINGANPAYHVRVMNADGTNIREVLGPDGGLVLWGLSWSPDAQWIVFAGRFDFWPAGHPELNAIGAGIYMIDVNGAALCQVTPLNNYQPVEAEPAWSPGPVPGWGPAKIVYSDDVPGISTRDLFFVDPACGATAVNVTGTPGISESSATWAPGQTRIAAGAGVDADQALLVFDVQAPLLSLAANLGMPAAMQHGPHYPDWSPTGSAIAFSDATGFASDLWLYSFDQGGWVQLTNTTDLNEHWPSWSPDGTKIAFSLFGGGSQVYVMDAVPGAPARPLTSGKRNRYQEPDYRAF